MSDEKLYGASTMQEPRWRRVVRELDKSVPNWRREHENFDCLGDDAVQAINNLAKPKLDLKLKPVPGSPVERASPRTADDYKPSDLTQDNLGSITLTFANKHGRQAAVRALKEFGATSVRELQLGRLRDYFEFVFEELKKPAADDAPTQSEWNEHGRYFKGAHRMFRVQLERIKSGNLPPWMKR